MDFNVIKNNASMIFTALGSVGVVTTAYFASEEAPAAKEALNEKRPKSVYEHLMITIPRYKKTIVSGGLTISSIVAAQVINEKKLTALAGSYAAMGGLFSRYKNTARKYLGREKFEELDENFKENEQEMRESNAEIVHWFYEPITGRFFEASWKDIWEAIDDAHKILTLEGGLKFNDWVYFLGINGKPLPDTSGWDAGDLLCAYDYPWIDIDFEERNNPENGAVDFNFNDGKPTFELIYRTPPEKMGALTEMI